MSLIAGRHFGGGSGFAAPAMVLREQGAMRFTTRLKSEETGAGTSAYSSPMANPAALRWQRRCAANQTEHFHRALVWITRECLTRCLRRQASGIDCDFPRSLVPELPHPSAKKPGAFGSTGQGHTARRFDIVEIRGLRDGRLLPNRHVISSCVRTRACAGSLIFLPTNSAYEEPLL